MATAETFAAFGRRAAENGSPRYAEWGERFARDPALIALIERARPSQRQPVLVFAVIRMLDAPTSDFDLLRVWLLAHAVEVLAELDQRLTQTNDVRRVAPIALALARIRGPVALIEVGASAGLGLFVDRYRVTFTTPGATLSVGDAASRVRLSARVDGELPDPGDRLELPAIVSRHGIDLAPLDVRSPHDMRWLETLLWPGQTERLDLLRAAIAIARDDPPLLVAGDAVDALAEVVTAVRAESGPEVTVVVIASGTLVYLPGARRQAFVDQISGLGVRWISYERTGSLTGVDASIRASAPKADWFATLALDGHALALGDAFGTRLLPL